MIKYRFSKERNKEFSQVLKKRINNYFKESNVSRNANSEMFIKTAVAITTYLSIFIFILLSGISNTWVLLGLWMLLGVAQAVIGASVMHDGLHGSFSKIKWLNGIAGFSAYIVGANPRMWKIQHNMLHHTYTNIEHADEDMDARFVLRFSPNQKRRWFHRGQHYYAVFFYSLLTLIWVTTKDFTKLMGYKKKGLVAKGREFNLILTEIILQKIAYHAVFLALPIILLDQAWWITVLMFIAMHMVTGVILSLVFQTAHIVPTSEFVEQEEELIDENFAAHQILTTSNFARDSKVLSWLIGGLNFQIEHHLFPNICHVHYRKISSIVEETAKEYGLPYHSAKSFSSAVGAHLSMLKELGKADSHVPVLA